MLIYELLGNPNIQSTEGFPFTFINWDHRFKFYAGILFFSHSVYLNLKLDPIKWVWQHSQWNIIGVYQWVSSSSYQVALFPKERKVPVKQRKFSGCFQLFCDSCLCFVSITSPGGSLKHLFIATTDFSVVVLSSKNRNSDWWVYPQVFNSLDHHYWFYTQLLTLRALIFL